MQPSAHPGDAGSPLKSTLVGVGVAAALSIVAWQLVLFVGAVSRGIPVGAPQLFTLPMALGALVGFVLAFGVGGFVAGRMSGRTGLGAGLAIVGTTLAMLVAALFVYGMFIDPVELMIVGYTMVELAAVLGIALALLGGLATWGTVVGSRVGAEHAEVAAMVRMRRPTRAA